jgi:hypothetical protein
MKTLLSLAYWFNLRPGTFSRNGLIIYLAILGVLAVLILVSFLLKNRKSIYRPIYKRVHAFSITNLLIGLLWLFFSYELLPILSARFWLLLWGAGAAFWLYFIGKVVIKIPLLREQKIQEAEYRKYIP